MKVRIVSDLHIDFEYKPPLYYGEDLLILAGDISNTHLQTIDYINEYLCLNEHVKVIYVLGNHDYYHSTIEEMIWFWENVDIPRLYFLHNNIVCIDNITFYGTTLWTDMNKGDKHVIDHFLLTSDYVYIRDFNPYEGMRIHKETVALLKTFLEHNKHNNLVIITHHLPSYSCITEKYKESKLNGAYASDLDNIIKNNDIKLWIHGHTHRSNDIMLYDTRIVCNPKGYVDENEKYKNDYILSL